MLFRSLEQAISLYNPQQHRCQAILYGHEERGVTSLSYAAWTLWHLGYGDQALTVSHDALTLADKLVPPFSQAFALSFAAWFHLFRREGDLAREQAQAAIDLSIEQGFPYWLAMGTILHGWALIEQSQGEEGIMQMRQGLAAYLAGGAELGRPLFLSLLAETYGKAGQIDEGLTVLTEALALVNRTGERSSEAELYRLAGELSLQTNEPENRRAGETEKKKESPSFADSPIPRFPVSSPEACFLKAIEVAQKQQAKSLELRAVMSLVRLWQQQGKTTEAHERLSEIYNWFTEGFNTKDLQEAKALLEELGKKE